MHHLDFTRSPLTLASPQVRDKEDKCSNQQWSGALKEDGGQKTSLCVVIQHRVPTWLFFFVSSFLDHLCRRVHRGGGPSLAHEALLLFWVWGSAGGSALHHEGGAALLLLLLRVPLRRVLRLLWGAHWYAGFNRIIIFITTFDGHRDHGGQHKDV